jgi:hypothetical protein
VFVRYPPGKIRHDGDRPIALLGVRVAPSFRLVDLPLGLPTTSARTSRGAWALYPIGAEVVVVHPDGAVSGPPAAVAAEVGRLAPRDRQGDLDRQAPWTIQRLLTGDGPARVGPGRLGGQDLVHPGQGVLAERPRQPPPARRHRDGRSPRPERQCRARHGRSRHPCRLSAGSGQRPGSRRSSATAHRASTPTWSPRHPQAAAGGRSQ